MKVADLSAISLRSAERTAGPAVDRSRQIAQTLGVSYRVLNYAFQDNLGVSPYQYFLAERLHSARRQLTTSTGSVTEACFSYGFSTPSRFARQYKRLFAELPSETKNKSIRTCVDFSFGRNDSS